MFTPPTYYVATHAIPELGIRQGYQISIDGDRATIAFEMDSKHITPAVLAQSTRRVHVPDAGARVRIG
jgi:hypothetical protein